MKLFIFIPLCFLFISTSYAQETQDSTKTKKEFIILPGEEDSISHSAETTKEESELPFILIKPKASKTNKDSVQSVDEKQFFFIGKKTYSHNSFGKKKNVNYNYRPDYDEFDGHWDGIYYGFIKFAELPVSHNYLKLDWGGSFSIHLNPLKYSIEFSKNFGLVTGIGFEYQRLKFSDDNISIVKTEEGIRPIIPLVEYPEMAEIKRSVFKNLYLTIPILMEVQFPSRNRRQERVYMSAGIIGGVRLHSKTKIVYDDQEGDKHKKKNKGDFNVLPIKADATARIGHRSIFIWGSYSLTSLFNTDNTPDLYLCTIGVGVNF